MMNQIKLTNKSVHSEKFREVPIAELHMMTDQAQLFLIAECKKRHPEFYTKENLAKIYEQSEALDYKLPFSLR